MMGYQVQGISHCALSWGAFPVESQGREVQAGLTREATVTLDGRPSSPRVHSSSRTPRGTDTYFVNTHLLESCLQHLEVVDVFMF